VGPDLEQQLVNCKKEIQRLARKNLRDEIENNMQPKTLTLVFDDTVNDLACIRVGDLSVKNLKKIRSSPCTYRNLKIAQGFERF
jgi:hypothetical protein